MLNQTERVIYVYKEEQKKSVSGKKCSTVNTKRMKCREVKKECKEGG